LQHINIADFDLDESKTTGEVYFNGKTSYFDINFLEFEEYTCVYARPSAEVNAK